MVTDGQLRLATGTTVRVNDPQQGPKKGGAPAMAAVPHSKKNEAQSALAVLGYGSAEIAAALKDIDMEALTLEDIIRQALKRMMK